MDEFKVVLGIDPGAATGWALVRYPGEMLVNAGTWELSHTRLEGGGMMFMRLAAWLRQTINGNPFLKLVSMEDVRRHDGTAAAHLYGGITATVTTVCEEYPNLAYTGVGVGVWKKMMVGTGNASKETVARSVPDVFGNTGMILLDKKGRLMQDAVDAAMIAAAAARQLGWNEIGGCVTAL